MTIKEIAKKTSAKFKENGYVFTPDEYAKEFCNEAKKARVIVKDCNKVAEFITKLDKKYQQIAKNYNIRNLDELVIFLIIILLFFIYSDKAGAGLFFIKQLAQTDG